MSLWAAACAGLLEGVLRILFGLTTSRPAWDIGSEASCVMISWMSGFCIDLDLLSRLRVSAAFASARAKREGIETVRGCSLPLAAIFGVPIWRERTSFVCASIRWIDSSNLLNQCQNSISLSQSFLTDNKHLKLGVPERSRFDGIVEDAIEHQRRFPSCKCYQLLNVEATRTKGVENFEGYRANWIPRPKVNLQVKT